MNPALPRGRPVPRLEAVRRLLLGAACALALPALAQAQAQNQDQAQAQLAAPVPALLRFADFFALPLGPNGLRMTPALQAAHGQRVRLAGYMVQQERPMAGRFMFVPRPVRMSEHADGDADDLPAAWVMVYLDESQKDFNVPYQSGLLEISGQLSVGRLEEKDGRVSWVRLQLAPEATRGMNAFEVSNYLHSLQHLH